VQQEAPDADYPQAGSRSLGRTEDGCSNPPRHGAWIRTPRPACHEVNGSPRARAQSFVAQAFVGAERRREASLSRALSLDAAFPPRECLRRRVPASRWIATSAMCGVACHAWEEAWIAFLPQLACAPHRM